MPDVTWLAPRDPGVLAVQQDGDVQAQQVVDVLGEPYAAEEIALPDDDEGAVVATLVTRPRDPGTPDRGAVLHVHGFADYFFQTGYADWWAARGYAFHALDLRKHGRSLRPHQTPNYVADLQAYDAELDEAVHRVVARDGHRRLVLSAHSTGGLVVPLWADRRRRSGDPVLRRVLGGLVLNSPWFDMQGAWWMRSLGTAVVDQVGRRRPKLEVPRTVTGVYARSLHRDHDGEWDFDLAWKPLASWPVHAGWLRAVRAGHAQLHRGLEVGCPALVLSSAASGREPAGSPTEGPVHEVAHRTDVVLDVAQIRRWAPCLGHHVTSVAVDGARHDVVLSRPGPRAQVYAALDRWATAWVDGPADQPPAR